MVGQWMTTGNASGYLKTSAGRRSLPCEIALHYNMDELGPGDIVVTLRSALVTLVDGEAVLSFSRQILFIGKRQGCHGEIRELSLS